MDNEKTKPKKKSIWAKLFKPSGPAKAEAKDNRPSIAERINWGGQFSDDKKKPKGKSNTY